MQITTFTASEARKKLYTLLKEVSEGLASYEITIRGSGNPVVLINKSELESWQETLDILISPKEVAAVRKARKEKKILSQKSVLKSLGLS